jgi:4-diphosphocytidyl-2-C-methyl-D-erythritol kinase
MSISVSCPPKLNRFLAVLGRRADGFHELELVTTVLEGLPELTDTLSAEPASELSLTLGGPTSEGLVADASNLVIQAWRLLEEAAGRSLPAALHLEKRIPHGAGLGGGSSDAAGALRLGNQMFELGLAADALLRLAGRLGSDVPLFLLGGTSLGLGRGERVFPLRTIPLEPILLVHPGLYVGTPGVYRALQSVGYPFPEALASQPAGQAPPWRNDLTGAAIWVCPLLADVREALLAAGGDPLLCGSGSCWAGRFATPAERDAAVATLRGSHPEWQLWAV